MAPTFNLLKSSLRAVGSTLNFLDRFFRAKARFPGSLFTRATSQSRLPESIFFIFESLRNHSMTTTFNFFDRCLEAVTVQPCRIRNSITNTFNYSLGTYFVSLNFSPIFINCSSISVLFCDSFCGVRHGNQEKFSGELQ